MKGILFTTLMIQAIIENRKSCTRRLDHLKEINQEPDRWVCTGTDGTAWGFKNLYTDKQITIKSRYLPDEVVYVKEAHYAYGEWNWRNAFHEVGNNTIRFTDNAPDPINKGHELYDIGWYLRSPLFLKAVDARTFNKILSVRPERLQSITREDIRAEGIILPPAPRFSPNQFSELHQEYAALWDSINKVYQWNLNPWVWRYEFIRIGKPKE